MSILFIGDSFTRPDTPYTVWPSLISQRLGNYPIVNRAIGGSGYVRTGTSSKPSRFLRQGLYQPPKHTNLVVIFGSCNDRTILADQTDFYKHSVLTTHLELARAYPNADQLIVTPQWSGPEVKPAEIDIMQGYIYDAMYSYDWKYPLVNPNSNSSEWWFPPNRPELWEGDQFHPSQLGHNRMADKLEPHIRKLLNL